MLIGIRIREQFLTADHLVGDGGQFGDEVHHLVFEDRGAQFLNGLRVLLEELIELTLLTGELAGTLGQRLIQFLLRDGDRVLFTHFGQHEAEAHTTFRNLAVLGANFLFRFIQIGDRLVLVLQLMLELLPDLVELLLNHCRRQFEIMNLVEPVQHGALQMLARHAGIIALHLFGQRLAELFKAFNAEARGELIIHLHFCRRLHFLHLDLKDSVFAGQMFRTVIGRESHLHLDLVARGGAHKLFFEAGNEAA